VLAGLGGPDRDIEDVGDILEGKISKETQDDDGPLLDRKTVEFAFQLVSADKVGNGIIGSGRLDVGHHVQLDESPAIVTPHRPEAGANRESMEPCIERVGVAECAQSLPGRDERLLDRVLGAATVAEDEGGNSELASRGRVHKL